MCLLLSSYSWKYLNNHFYINLDDFFSKVINIGEKKVKININNLPYKQNLFDFHRRRIKYYDGLIFFYNTEDFESFKDIQYLYKEVRPLQYPNVAMSLFGFKKINPIISKEEGEMLANEYHMNFYEGVCVDYEVIKEVIENLVQRIYDTRYKEKIEQDVKKKKKMCFNQ